MVTFPALALGLPDEPPYGRGMRILAPLSLAALLVTGCLSTQIAVPAVDDPREHPSLSPTPSPESENVISSPPPEISPVWELAEEPECEEGAWAATFSMVDGALGSWFLWVRVKNCGNAAAAVPLPGFHGLGTNGGTVPLTAGLRGEKELPTLLPGEETVLELKWLHNGRCERGASRLFLTLDGQEFSPSHDCLSIGGHYAPERDIDISIEVVTD